MEESNLPKILFVVNPVSGGNNKKVWEDAIHTHFANTPQNYQMITLTGFDDHLLIRNYLDSFKPQKVIAVGGDGTINLIVSQIVGTNIALGILPAGSANGLATELNLPFSIEEAMEVILGNHTKKIDLIQFNNKEHCVHLSDVGLNALVIKDYTLKKMRGKWGYLKSIYHVLQQRKLIKTSIQLNGQTLNRNTYMVVFANARSYGSGALINPLGDLCDGKFEVVVVKELSIWELLKMLLTHAPFDSNKIEIFQTDEVTVTTEKKVFFQIDGEFLGRVNTLHAAIKPAAILVLLPE